MSKIFEVEGIDQDYLFKKIEELGFIHYDVRGDSIFSVKYDLDHNNPVLCMLWITS
jgi:hypothetical protein